MCVGVLYRVVLCSGVLCGGVACRVGVYNDVLRGELYRCYVECVHKGCVGAASCRVVARCAVMRRVVQSSDDTSRRASWRVSLYGGVLSCVIIYCVATWYVAV